MNNINTSFTSNVSPEVHEELDPHVQSNGFIRNNSHQNFTITPSNAPLLTPRNIRANIDPEHASVQNFNDNGMMDSSKKNGPRSAMDESKATEKLNS